MAFTKNHRNCAQLTGHARAEFRLHVENYATANLLPIKPSASLYYSIPVGQGVLPAAASFRSWNTESEVGDLPAGEERGGKLPPISIRTPVDEYQELVMYNADDDIIGEAFEERAARNAQAIGSRFVLAQVEALVFGRVTLQERQMNLVVDFGRKPAQTATAGTLWNVANADPIADLEGLRQVMGKGVTSTFLPRSVMSLLQTNTEIIKLVTGRGTDLPSRVSEQDVRSVLADWGFGYVEINEQTIVNRAGAEVPLFPADRVVLVSGSQVGDTLLGVTAESIQPENGISRKEAPGLFSGATHSHDPEGYNVLVSALGIPVLTAADNTASLKVK
ncbi:major capsid protein [Microbacterium sp. YY-01]|uniref:major capsid protein n=1 Tax=Microbacterium sp. YY-01 TaxID=3421634 RepID=UPI003D1666E4